MPTRLSSPSDAVGTGGAPDPAEGGRSASWGDLPSEERRILVVDDVAANREVAAVVLRNAGYVVDVASSAAEALHSVKAQCYGLVLMDVHMPVVDGLAATRAIRALAGGARRVPIVALTADSRPDRIDALRAAGMDDHVEKPFAFEELKAKAAFWCGAATSAGVEQPAFAPNALKQISDLIGPARTQWFLDELDARLLVPFADRSDLARTGSEAHALISQAGQLGFEALAWTCREVEAACVTGRPADDLIDRALDAAEAARTVIARLRAA